MQDVSDISSALIIESDQGADTFVQNALGQAAVARLLSFRCQEAQKQSLPCQDYARVGARLIAPQGSSISFCVCDGVGSSYKGNFAAQYLGICLVDWLQQLKVIPRKPSKVLKALRPRFDQWADEAQGTLECFEISPELPTLVREVLEELRNTYGSETVFFGGRIDFVAPRATTRVPATHPLHPRPYASRASRAHGVNALFFWMGNVSARLFTGANQHIDLGDGSDDSNRWSTLRGQRGRLTTRVLALDTIERLMIYTDGLETIGKELADLSDDELRLRAQQLLLLPGSDDMTVLDLQWFNNSTGKEGQA